MTEKQVIHLPDVGVSGAEVIEVMVKPGDSISKEDALITLESDKATMDVPSPFDGVVEKVLIALGDKLSEGDALIEVVLSVQHSAETVEDTSETSVEVSCQSGELKDVTVPDIGGSTQVEIIELAVAEGDTIDAEDTLITLESDKATMDVPSPYSGKIAKLHVQVGDRVSADDLVASIALQDVANNNAPVAPVAPVQEAVENRVEKVASQPVPEKTHTLYAGPAVRRLARELDIDLMSVTGTGNKGRITKDDLNAYVKNKMASGGGASTGLPLPEMPEVDFSQFGQVHTEELSKIQKLSGRFLHRNWVSIPHVTQFGEADITELESFRQSQKSFAQQAGVRLTALVFIMKAVVHSLKAFPRFNASLHSNGNELILKNYYHIGVAVDTPHGLVVPVIRDVDKKSLLELAKELASVSETARTTGLSMSQMQGGCFTISSLGGIGGTAFTPIINAPEVAILGVSRSSQKPIFENGEWLPRLMLPLSLSYDHRVIDGALGARFMVHLSQGLSDIRQLLL